LWDIMVLSLIRGEYLMPELVTEIVGGEPYQYCSLGDYVVRAVGVCGGRPTFKYTTVRQKAKNPQSTYVRVRRVREDVFSWSAPGASLQGEAWPASDM